MGRGLRPFSRQNERRQLQGLSKQAAVVLHKFPLWRGALKDVLDDLGFELLLATASEDKAVSCVERSEADLFVVGASETIDAVECARQARKARAGVRVAVVAPTYDKDQADAALAAGAYVYIVETAPTEDIRAAIRQGFETSVFLGSGEAPAGERAVRPTPVKPEAHGLTKREQEILRLVSEGRSNGEVARKLWVTEQTVKFHLSNIYRKLGVTNRTEAGRQAQLIGLLDDDSARESISG
jgi:DNA-binding NarL/FixJ family response regulator